jgi:acyl-CoA thioester hydrolase
MPLATMADLPLELCEPVCRMKYRVIKSDTDAGSVIYNGNYLRFMEMGRTEMMRSVALSVSDMQSQGILLPVTESFLRYTAYGRCDDLITIATSLAELTQHTLTFYCRVSCPRDEKELLLVKGFTKLACADLHGNLMPYPEEFLSQIRRMRSVEKR